MKIIDILNMENRSDGLVCLNLIKEGNFWRAYEGSAHLFFEHFKTYRIIKRHFKNVKLDLVYLGFPESALAGHLAKAVDLGATINQQAKSILIMDLEKVTGFDSWKQAIPIKDVAPKTDIEPLVSSSNTGLSKDFLMAHKLGYECVLDLIKMTEKLPREHKFTIGERLRNASLDALLALWKLASGRSETKHLEKVEDALDEMRILLRVLCDLKFVELASFANISQKVELLSRQSLAWK